MHSILPALLIILTLCLHFLQKREATLLALVTEEPLLCIHNNAVILMRRLFIFMLSFLYGYFEISNHSRHASFFHLK